MLTRSDYPQPAGGRPLTTSLLLLLVLSSFLFATTSSADSRDATEKSRLIIASSNNFPPINVLDEEGELSGFARELSTAVAEAIDVEVVYRHSAIWSDVLQWIDAGEADLIHDTGYTPERESYLDFTDPIIEMPESIFVRNGQLDIHNLKSLYGKKVACVNRHITHIYLKRFEQIQCHLVNTPAEGLIALINGNADAFIYPEQIVIYLAQRLKLNDEIKVIGEPLRVLSWSMTVKDGNSELVERLNRGIRIVKHSGRYQEIYDKWFGKPLLSGYDKQEVLIISVSATLLSALIIVTIGLLFYTRGIRNANHALRESENKYRTLADKLPQYIFLKDTGSVYISCNQRYADSLGIKPEDIVGKDDFELHPEQAEKYRSSDRLIMESGNPHEFVETFLIDGKTNYINTIKTPVYNEDGELQGVLGIFWDITEEKVLQEKLSSTIKEYNAITATVPDIMYKLDTDGRLTWWNQSLEETFAPDDADLYLKPFLDTVTAEDKTLVETTIKKIIDEGYGEVEAELDTANGIRVFNLNGARLLDEDNRLIGLAGTGRDITVQKEHELQQQLLQNQLTQAQKMEAIGHLTGGIAHDFNNMLTVILGFSELAIEGIRTDKPDETLTRYLNSISQSGTRAKELVAQMLTFSRTQKGEPKRVVIDDMIAEVSTMLRPMLPTTIELQFDIEDEVPDILIDPVMLHQALVNLCINARDAMIDAHGKINIQARRTRLEQQNCIACHGQFEGDFIELTISDDGEGIPADMINSIFTPFFTTKAVGKGSGMGLAMVHGIIHENDGHIHVESEPGNTRITIYLPVKDIERSDTEDEARPGLAQPVNDEQQHHILVVDDELVISDLLEEVLTDISFRVSTENDAQSALKRFQDDPQAFDLVITDQTMPRMTGSEMAQEMLKLKPELPIIIMTGYSESIDENSARTLGLKGFLRKPIEMSELITRIMQLLGKDD